MMWAGWTDMEKEGTFTDVNTGKALDYDIWWPGEPNGGVLENCAVSWPTRGAWIDYMCFETAKGFCNIQPRPRLIMRGLSLQEIRIIQIILDSCIKKAFLRTYHACLTIDSQWQQIS